MRNVIFLIAAFIAMVSCTGCNHFSLQTTEIRHLPVGNLENIITAEQVYFDKDISSDGNGSIKIDCVRPTVIELYVLDDIDIEEARLIYEAKLRSENLEGTAYLEMYCCFDDLGEYFSRGLQSPITGNSEWNMTQTPFFLQRGQNPNRVKLNVVINGSGTVWVDDIRLSKGPLI